MFGEVLRGANVEDKGRRTLAFEIDRIMAAEVQDASHGGDIHPTCRDSICHISQQAPRLSISHPAEARGTWSFSQIGHNGPARDRSIITSTGYSLQASFNLYASSRRIAYDVFNQVSG